VVTERLVAEVDRRHAWLAVRAATQPG
jgi:hypothetical protein